MSRVRNGDDDDEGGKDDSWSMRSSEELLYEGRIYAPEPSWSDAIRLHHDVPESGHFGIARTTDLVSRNFYWAGLEPSVRQYVLTCDVCARIKASRHRHFRPSMPNYPLSNSVVGRSNDKICTPH